MRCPGCGLASATCQDAFGRLLARSYTGYERVGLRSVHQILVDAYAAQHPGGTDRRQVQTVALCLMTLQLVVEDGVDPTRGSELHAVMADHPAAFHVLSPPAVPARTTVADVLGADAPGYEDAVRAWGVDVWASWSEHHETVREWNRECLTGRVRLP